MAVEKMIDLAEIVAQLGLSRSTIFRMVKSGRFPAPLRVGARAVRWREADVAAWQQSKSRDCSA